MTIDPRRWTAILVVLVAVTACQGPVAPSPDPDSTQLTISFPIRTTDKALVLGAVDVMSERLRSLRDIGVGSFASSAGTDLTFTIALDKAADQSAVEAAVRSPGVVSFIGWTAGDPPQVGSPAPAGVTPLFNGTDQIISAAYRASADSPTIDIVLGPEGTAALASFTRDHVGGYLVIVLDGKVLAAPVVMTTISNGLLALTLDPPGPIPPEAIAAIMTSGPLPARWIAP